MSLAVLSAEQIPLYCFCQGAHKAVLCLALLGRCQLIAIAVELDRTLNQ